MHVCSNDLEKSSRIYLFSLVCSVITFFFVLLPFYNMLKLVNIIIPIWIETPSIIGLYSLFLGLFDKYLWKYDFIKYIGLPKISNLNGNWKATINSSFNNTSKKADVSISQTFSKFCMILKTDESVSETVIAHLKLNTPNYQTIAYSYICKPNGISASTMNTHEGTACLEIIDNTKLKGDYYTGRGRETHGEITMERA